MKNPNTTPRAPRQRKLDALGLLARLAGLSAALMIASMIGATMSPDGPWSAMFAITVSSLVGSLAALLITSSVIRRRKQKSSAATEPEST